MDSIRFIIVLLLLIFLMYDAITCAVARAVPSQQTTGAEMLGKEAEL